MKYNSASYFLSQEIALYQPMFSCSQVQYGSRFFESMNSHTYFMCVVDHIFDVKSSCKQIPRASTLFHQHFHVLINTYITTAYHNNLSLSKNSTTDNIPLALHLLRSFRWQMHPHMRSILDLNYSIFFQKSKKYFMFGRQTDCYF